MVFVSTAANGYKNGSSVSPNILSQFRKYGVLSFLFFLVVWTVCYRQASIDDNRQAPSSRIQTGNHQSTSLRKATNPTDTNKNQNDNDQCRFYLAESAIPQSGLGLFTAVDLKPGDEAQSMADVCVYVADTPRKTHFETHSWARDVFFGSFEGRNPRAACEGFATLFNSMPPGVQTSKLVMIPEYAHHNAGLHRKSDPGAGAVTQYYGITSTATRNVQAGSELTIDYGDWSYDSHRTYKAPSRPVSWLREHGMCIDNIRIRIATDPSMGRGAFAARSLSKGTVVAPAPVQFFPKRSIFAKQTPEALFVNYCFQLSGTSILAFPYGPGVNMINHSKKSPNVKVQWSKHPMHHSHWLTLPMQQFWQMDYPGGLILDIVALRDIQPGEELFMDYGDEWQQAWDSHVQNWKPLHNSTEYVYETSMDLSQPFRTVLEQETNPYPSNLATVCHTRNWERDDYTIMRWKQPVVDWPEGLIFCHILKREETASGEFLYQVSLNFSRHPDRPDEKRFIDTNVPQRAIRFVDKPYQSDLHLPNAFRHPIMLPSDLVSSEWKDFDAKNRNKKS